MSNKLSDVNTYFQAKWVISTVVAAVSVTAFLTGTYFDMRHKQDEILSRITLIEEALSEGERFSAQDMSRFTAEFKILNPDIILPAAFWMAKKD